MSTEFNLTGGKEMVTDSTADTPYGQESNARLCWLVSSSELPADELTSQHRSYSTVHSR
jgi:hypothetical protein